jgi:hypothetical protein
VDEAAKRHFIPNARVVAKTGVDAAVSDGGGHRRGITAPQLGLKCRI